MDEDLHPLSAGTAAPPFALPCSPRERFGLTRAAGRPLVILFYPGDWEPASSEQLRRYDQFRDEFVRLGAQVIAVSPDSVWCHRAFARERRLRFPLLSDASPIGAAARAYGVWQETAGRCGRALFVLDDSGVIRFSRAYPPNFVPSLDDVLSVLTALHERT